MLGILLMSASSQIHQSYGYIYEDKTPFSQSSMWQRHHAFYSTEGVTAWSTNTVPHYITNNPTLAGSYAQIVLGFFRDYQTGTSPDNPINIIELGAGSGRFAYHFLHQLSNLLDHVGFNPPNYRYVLTDLSEASLEFYADHEKFQPFFEKGILDYVRFDAQTDQTMTLRRSGKTFSKASLEHPLFIFGNYFFDSIIQDGFYANDGLLYELHLSQYTSEPMVERAPNLSTEITYVFDYEPITPEYYGNPTMSGLLEEYRTKLVQSHFTFPKVGISMLERLRTWSQSGLVLLSADKGYHYYSQMHGRSAPYIDSHGSAISLGVNFHALTRYFGRHGAKSFVTEHHSSYIDVVGILLLDNPNAFPEIQMAYWQFVDRAGPDDFFLSKKVTERHIHSMSFDELLAFIRRSSYDAHIFNQFASRLHELISSSNLQQHADLILVMNHVWAQYYAIGEEVDLKQNIINIRAEINRVENQPYQ